MTISTLNISSAGFSTLYSPDTLIETAWIVTNFVRC
jgi:hypothetical protein